jgi:protein-tyrosine phosphatase
MHFFDIGEAFPYNENAKKYLTAGENANVADFFVFAHHPNEPITLRWTKVSAADRYEVELFPLGNASEPQKFILSASDDSLELFNLYKAAEYRAKITAFKNNLPIDTAAMTFKTTALGPRVMKVDGIYNVRDLGGYTTECGKTTRQGLIYRGGALSPADVYDSNLTPLGKDTMKNVLKIKTEIDLRHPDESGISGNSLIPGAELIQIPLGAYDTAFSDCPEGKSAYQKLFSTIAQSEKYPIYIHCTGGADRTGTVAFILNALLGVPEEILIQDYEFTSFSVYHMRNTREGAYRDYFKKFRDSLNSFKGNTLQEKTETYLLSIGITETEIETIKRILLE